MCSILGFSSISCLTCSFVNGIMGRKEHHYPGGPQHMLEPCTKQHAFGVLDSLCSLKTHTEAHV